MELCSTYASVSGCFPLAVLLMRANCIDVGSYRSLITAAARYSIVFVHTTVCELWRGFQYKAFVISTAKNIYH